MKVASVAQIKDIDRRAIMDWGIPGAVLMENAGRGCAVEAAKMLPEAGGKVCILCGRGNNGGDGFVVARYLRNFGNEVRVFLACEPEEISGDARIHFHALSRMDVAVKVIVGSKNLYSLKQELASADLVVDALLGTGTSGEVRGFYAELIKALNDCSKRIIAVDVPSGLNADTGAPCGACVKAEATVTFGLPKLGLYLGKGQDYAGRIVFQDIGIPKECEEGVETSLLTEEAVRQLLPRHPRTAHKGEIGSIYLAAGSVGMTGAAALAAESALKAGAGLVILGVPESLNPILEAKLTEVITMPLRETPEQGLDLAASDAILEGISKADAGAIGPGIARHPRTIELITKLLREVEKPLVVDADALYALAEEVEVLESVKAPLILTPHVGEMARLLGKNSQEVLFNCLPLTKDFACRYGVVVVLKQARSLICAPSGEAWINQTGNPGMATAGSGDVLTGIMVSFLAQGLEPWAAACGSVYLHGLAGDMVAEVVGEASVTADSVLEMIPSALQKLVRSKPSG